MDKARRRDRADKPGKKIQQGYQLPPDLVHDYRVFAAELGCRPCVLVEDAMREAAKRIRSRASSVSIR